MTDTEQAEQIERVRGKISAEVHGFCVAIREDFARQGRFRMDELTAWVKARAGVAPDSPGRILRDMRQRGRIDYRVVDRAGSLYEITRVAE